MFTPCHELLLHNHLLSGDPPRRRLFVHTCACACCFKYPLSSCDTDCLFVCLFDTNTGFAYESAIAEQWYFSHSKYNCVIQSVFMHFLWYSVYSNIAILTSLLFRVALCVFFFQHASDQSSSTEDTTSDASPAAGTPKRMKPWIVAPLALVLEPGTLWLYFALWSACTQLTNAFHW